MRIRLINQHFPSLFHKNENNLINFGVAHTSSADDRSVAVQHRRYTNHTSIVPNVRPSANLVIKVSIIMWCVKNIG